MKEELLRIALLRKIVFSLFCLCASLLAVIRYSMAALAAVD